MENDKLNLGTLGTLELIKNSYQITNKFKTGLLRWILQHLVKKLRIVLHFLSSHKRTTGHNKAGFR